MLQITLTVAAFQTVPVSKHGQCVATVSCICHTQWKAAIINVINCTHAFHFKPVRNVCSKIVVRLLKTILITEMFKRNDLDVYQRKKQPTLYA